MDETKSKSKRRNYNFAVKWAAQQIKKGNSNRHEAKRLQTTSIIMWLHCTVPTMWKWMLYKSFCLKLSVCIPTRSSSSQPEIFCTGYSTEQDKYQQNGLFFPLTKGGSM